MNTAEYIIKRLEELDVNEFFGIPGHDNLNILYIIKNNPNTKFIGCTNSLNAGYAANGYARIKGYGALVTTYGAEELNSVNTIADSLADNVPVMHIVGLPALNNRQKTYLDIYKQITGASAILNRDNAKLEIDRAIKTMVREKKPVYIGIPKDIALLPISDKTVSYDWISDKNILEELSAKIAEKIKNSKKPVIIGDTLIKRFDTELEYKEFVTKSGIPFSNFYTGINLADMNSENYIGTYLGKYRNPIAQKYIEESDCIITVGAIGNDTNPTIEMPFNIDDHIAVYGNYTFFEGKKYDNIKMSEVLETVTNLIERMEIEIDKTNFGLKPQDSSSEQLDCSYIFSRIQDFVKENDIIIADKGSIPFGLAQMKFPASTIVEMQSQNCSMGWATPAILGVCMAKPQSRVILITGDGAHTSTLNEVGTMLKNKIKPIAIVINNNGYTTQRYLCNDTQNDFNNTLNINFAKFARIFEGDVWSTQANTKDDFDKALKVTQIMNKMCYIEAITDSMDIPSLAKEVVSDTNIQTEKTDYTQNNENNVYNDIKDVVFDSKESGLEYETIVHKGIDEEMINESEGE